MMKKFRGALFCFSLVAVLFACKKTSFITSGDALLTTSTDTLHYDTVFTTTGSITRAFKIFNLNDRKLRLSQVKLMGGSASAFKINVDGSAGIEFNNIEMEPNDSIYVFATVTINPNAANLPFIVQDSILISYNGNKKFVQLDAFGQNAIFFRNTRVTRDTTWNNRLPYVILGGLYVDAGATLSIQKGSKIYCHADAPIIVNGTMKANGEKAVSDRITFRSDRLDEGYRDFPGSWPGLYFTSTSQNNVLTYTNIINAYQGVIAQLPAPNGQTKLTLNQCVFDNIYDAGILNVASTISATNCLVSNCGTNVAVVAGGNITMNHCTVASIGNFYLAHKSPVLSLSNDAGQNQINPLVANFTNCIFHGEGGTIDNEIVITKKGTPVPNDFAINFKNVLYKTKDDVTNATFTASLKNQPPLFDTLDVGKRIFDFHLRNNSPARNAGVATVPAVTIDLDGNPRPVGLPDMGCYEK
jgi:hypothetical protein